MLTQPPPQDVDIILVSLKQLEFENARLMASNFDPNLKKTLHQLINLYELNDVEFFTDSLNELKPDKENPTNHKSINLFLSGYRNSYSQEKRKLAYKNFKKLTEEDNSEFKKAAYIGIFKVLSRGYSQSDSLYGNHLKKYKFLLKDIADSTWYYLNSKNNIDQSLSTYYHKLSINDSLKNEKIIKKLIDIEQRISNHRLRVLINKALGDHFVSIDGLKAKEYYLNAKKNMDSSIFFNPLRYRLELDLARCEEQLGNNKKAIQKLHDSKTSFQYGNSTINKINYTFFLSEFHSKSKQYDSANYYLKEMFKLEHKQRFNQHNKAVSQLEIELDTAEKEKQIFVEQQKKKQNRNIAYSLGGLLLFGGITFLLIQKNTKRKQLLAEQEKELQVQKVSTLMKEQELTSIDAMIAGQEKERQRIANDLHDDLGGMMATVKLHFNTLKDKPSTELYNKTDKLLDEAYQKVRTIAHAKNSGVIAKEGLLKSVKDIAQKVSSSGKITINVIDHGLENRLENSLELTLFRVVQELITNIIKHAYASEATIHLTQHEDSLNIMVEDNGKGFNPKQLAAKKGMGLGTIDKRIDHLNGTLEIDSEIGRGTNIIIDIPI